MGRYILESTPEIVSLAYDWGLGAKNAQRFGLWEEEKTFLVEKSDIPMVYIVPATALPSSPTPLCLNPLMS